MTIGRHGISFTGSCLLAAMAIWSEPLPAQEPATNPAGKPAAPFPIGSAAEEGVVVAALEQLVRRSREAGSSALVVLKNGKQIAYELSGPTDTPVHVMSVTKSIVGLAIGMLVDSGKIASLDQPVADTYPEWRQGRKRLITVRHLLCHTSGLEAQRRTEEIYRSPDFVQLALCAELASAPGERFFYNNKAVNLLAGIVQRAAGEPLDVYLKHRLFEPLGIAEVSWQKDERGNPHVMAGLALRGIDLAKIGQLVVDEGKWRGRELVSRKWIEQSTTASAANPGYGLLWWLLPTWERYEIDEALLGQWRRAGVSDEFIAQTRPLHGRSLGLAEFKQELARLFGTQDLERYYEKTALAGLPAATVTRGDQVGFTARGDLGQQLVVIPANRLVAVRLTSWQPSGPRDDFPDFAALVLALVGR